MNHQPSIINPESSSALYHVSLVRSEKLNITFPQAAFGQVFFLGVELSTVCSRERRRSTRRTVGDFCPMPSMARLLRCRYFFPAAVGDVANGTGFACAVFSRCFNLLIVCFLVWDSAYGVFCDEDWEWRSVAQSHVSIYSPPNLSQTQTTRNTSPIIHFPHRFSSQINTHNSQLLWLPKQGGESDVHHAQKSQCHWWHRPLSSVVMK